ncbi:hypothetical protein [Nitrosomonas sp. sh817]|uniref:hypothetical protein n=1 Tax=Nitrosomonas sp. sh817 TaxID=3070658 RepID=UPI0027DCF0DC|nr:hypothetical protein [Nitrosomonas sp. sh817]WMJ09362.1 hypothetical protein RBH92_04000 [Nitrosomonas sp. sh817]
MSKSKKTINQTPSISNSEILKELRKARNCVSDISCALEFIDCGDLVDLDGCNMSISREQMEGLFNLLDGAVDNLEQIQQTVRQYGTLKETTKAICDSIEKAVRIILLAEKIERVRLAEYEEENGKKDLHYQVSLVKVWTAGFLVSLRLAKEYIANLFYSIEELCEAIPAPSEGGGNAHDSLH